MTVTADTLANQILRLDSPYDPEAVVETAGAVAELIRRLNHATVQPSALRYPSQLYRVIGSLNAAIWGLEQTLNQLATRCDQWSADPRLGHDENNTHAATTATQAAHWLRAAAGNRAAITGPLETARALTSHLKYRD